MDTKKHKHGEGGFTLVELLVTIAILAVLFGVVTLSLTGVGADAEDTVIIAECGIVQAAADIYLADDTTHTITARDPGDAAVINAGEANFTDEFLRDLPTSYRYSWTSQGDVTCHDVP